LPYVGGIARRKQQQESIMRLAASIVRRIGVSSCKGLGIAAAGAAILLAHESVAFAQKGGGGTSSVLSTIVNTVAQAVNMQQAPRQPYTGTFHIGIETNATSGFTWIDAVPPGKRLVIEHVSGSATLSTFEHVDMMAVFDPTAAAAHTLVPTAMPRGDSFVNHSFSQPMRAYISDAGAQDLAVVVNRMAPGPYRNANMTIVGYLVDVE
jgi:hypothetical protein